MDERGPVRRTVAQRRSLEHVAHRPWPRQPGRWLVGQSWEDLLFAHWPVDAAILRPLVPAPLELETFEGTAWAAVVAFAMRGVRFAWCPPVPGTSAFAEVNLRTYVSHGGRPGVFFLTLEAHNPVALLLGRRAYALPYRRAEVRLERTGAGIAFRSERARGGSAVFAAGYAPRGRPANPAPGTRDHWFTERYCFYTVGRDGALRRTEVHHGPWSLAPAEAEIGVNTLGEAYGLDLSDSPLVHFSRAQDVVAWPPRR